MIVFMDLLAMLHIVFINIPIIDVNILFCHYVLIIINSIVVIIDLFSFTVIGMYILHYCYHFCYYYFSYC